MNSIKWWLSEFGEVCYLPQADLRADYFRDIIRGKHIASSKSVLICGICRDIEPILPQTICRIERLGELFAEYRTYFFENDSKDNTANILREWADSNQNVRTTSETLEKKKHNQDTSLERREDLAYCRNKYIDFINLYESDYVIILDLDYLGGFSYWGILHSLAQQKDIIGSNSLYYQNNGEVTERLYYDWYAFREIDSWEPKAIEYVNKLQFHAGEPLIEVNSCFGGLCLYKRECFSHSFRYDASDCDHVSLAKKLKQFGYKIWLNPSQITIVNRNLLV